MSEESRTVGNEAAVDVAQILRRNYIVLLGLLVSRLLVSAVLIGIPMMLIVADKDAAWVGLPVASGVILAILTIYRITCGVRLRQAALVLREYPLEWCDSLEKKKRRWTEYGSVFTLRVGNAGREVTPDMWARRAAGPSRWPGGTEGGVWFAGDAPFGGVVIIPSSNAMMFMIPTDWEGLADDREQASPERIEKAKAAKIFKRSWRRANLQT